MADVSQKLRTGKTMERLREILQKRPSAGLHEVNDQLAVYGLKASGKMLGIARQQVFGVEALYKTHVHRKMDLGDSEYAGVIARLKKLEGMVDRLALIVLGPRYQGKK